ncbi:MAG: LytTR family DNA-binding domain-containing protein [Sediminibacterium sp.]|nr:LytTR family DNA-binding domain-containing protein [Sediminibacterium sp.]
MKFKCLIVDDEPLAIRLIEKHIAKLEKLEVIATCQTALKAFEIISTQQVDLLFLDIKMPDITGIEFLKNLKNPPKTILTTAYRDYALESYDLRVVDYLLKPITFERFFKSIDKFLEETQKVAPLGYSEGREEFIFIRSGIKNHKVLLKDILYIESLKDYIKITLSDRYITSKYKISDIETELDPLLFLRIHRSFIINVTKITAFTLNDIEVAGQEIPIGASYRDEVLAFLEKLKK